MQKVAAQCKAKPGDFRGGISTQTRLGQHREERPDAARLDQRAGEEAPARLVRGERACARGDRRASRRSRIRRSTTSARRSRTTRARSRRSTQALESSGISPTDKLVLQIRLAQAEDARLSTSQLLLQAKQVEAPSILTGAASQKVTARSRRNTVVVAALIGLILGALAALLWDGVAAPRCRRRLMLEGKRVAVVVPAHDEEKLIATTLARHPGLRRPDLRRRRRLARRDRRTGARARRPARRGRRARAQPRRRRGDRHRLQACARGRHRRRPA